MIESKEKLKLFLSEDWKINMHTQSGYNWLKHKYRLFCKSDSAMAVDYLRALRKYEYCSSLKTTFINRFIKKWRQWRLAVLSAKYDIHITPNAVGYGLYLPHIVGGGCPRT